jgi:hypothetical protein
LPRLFRVILLSLPDGRHRLARIVAEQAVDAGIEIGPDFRREVAVPRRIDSALVVQRQEVIFAPERPGMNLEPRGMGIAHQIRRLAEPAERGARDHHRLVRTDAVGISGDHFQPGG